MFEMKCVSQEDTLVILCSGNLDLESFEKFDNFFSENYSKVYQKVVINLQSLHYLSSVGLRSLLRSAKAVYADKNKVFVKAKEGMVKNIILLSGFHKILPLLEDEVHAVSYS